MRALLRILVRAAVAAALSMASNRSHAAGFADPSGTFTIEDGTARVRLERCGANKDNICGYIVWLKKATDDRGQPIRDVNNPDHEKQARTLLGHQFVLGLKATNSGRFEGDVYNAQDGKSYPAVLWRESSDQVKIKGCLIKLFCSTQTWRQTVDAVPGQLVAQTGDLNGPRADKEWAEQSRSKAAAAGKLR